MPQPNRKQSPVNPDQLASPTCIASSPPNTSGFRAIAGKARLRNQPNRSIDNMNSAINRGRNCKLACARSYCLKLPFTNISASAAACRNDNPKPSPEIASIDPDASPNSATLPRVTRRNRRVAVTAPRSALDVATPSNRTANSGTCAIASRTRSFGSREISATPTSRSPTGVTYNWNPGLQ